MHNATKFRALFQRPGIIKAVGAHDALSAKLIQQAGFDAIWASGFGISASLKCVPDASFVTSTQQLEVERNMVEAISIPIIADCDTGYGNALNVMRTVNDHERAGVAAICIEDNVYPKRCSFYAGVRRELIAVEEHCGKIKAAKAAQTVPDFMVIARTEALIAGWGQEEALKRAEAYAQAGADAVLIHSKSPTFDELKAVAKAWSGRVPLVVVPTIFDGVSADMRIAREEIFGPVLCAFDFRDEEDLIEAANGTDYGLAAGIWTHGLATAHRIAARLEAGIVTINEFPVTFPQTPFTGFKQSGLGHEQGVDAVDAYTRVKSVSINLE